MFKNTEFKRLFSMTMFKDKKIDLGKMTFTKDFINDNRGDLYPIIEKTNGCIEEIKDNIYYVKNGHVKRVIGQFFPFATYEIDFAGNDAGFEFKTKTAIAQIIANEDGIICSAGSDCVKIPYDRFENHEKTMLVSCRPGAFDIYFNVNGVPRFLYTFETNTFVDSNVYDVFSDGFASVAVGNDVTIKAVSFYIDCGISQADMRPIRYENGDIMVEAGKVYLTMSIRMQMNMFQGVFAWIPGTAQIELTGAVFYDSGDGRWCGDVAASILYHRKQKQWILWVTSFNHGHILAHSQFDGDIRFGINVVDITLMDKAPEHTSITEFLGMAHDEDPDFYFDESKNKWFMAICRKDPAINAYRYVFFKSDFPFEGYKYIGGGRDGAETGGSFVTVGGKKHFICGNDFNAVSDYRIYSENGMENARFNFPDGGFRGWGTLMPIRLGGRTRYFWMTFDRHNGSDYNWSYGNIYCFEGTI